MPGVRVHCRPPPREAVEGMLCHVDSVHRAGIDATLATVFGWPLAALQNGVLRSMFTDAGIDIYNIDGYLDGILSHKYAQTTPTRPAW